MSGSHPDAACLERFEFFAILQLIAATDITRTLSSLHHALFPDNEKK
jgi:hypothetical protein